MDKLSQTKGISLFEMLIVLFIVSVLSIGCVIPKDNLTIFVQRIMHESIICQEKAFLEKRDVFVSFTPTYASFDESSFAYPNGIRATSVHFHYNPKGNISNACTVTFENGRDIKKLVFQLGSGRVRIDEN